MVKISRTISVGLDGESHARHGVLIIHGGRFTGGDATYDAVLTKYLVEYGYGFDVVRVDFDKLSLTLSLYDLHYVSQYMSNTFESWGIIGVSSGGYLSFRLLEWLHNNVKIRHTPKYWIGICPVLDPYCRHVPQVVNGVVHEPDPNVVEQQLRYFEELPTYIMTQDVINARALEHVVAASEHIKTVTTWPELAIMTVWSEGDPLAPEYTFTDAQRTDHMLLTMSTPESHAEICSNPPAAVLESIRRFINTVLKPAV